MRIFLFCLFATSAIATCPVHLASYWPHNTCVTLDLDAVHGSLCELPVGKVLFRQLDPLDVSSGVTASFLDPSSASSQCPQGIKHSYDVICAPEFATVVQDGREDGACRKRHTLSSRFACPVATSSSSCAPVPIPTPTASQLAYQLREIVVSVCAVAAKRWHLGLSLCSRGFAFMPLWVSPRHSLISTWRPFLVTEIPVVTLATGRNPASRVHSSPRSSTPPTGWNPTSHSGPKEPF
jgi:hypothetical protein